MRREILFQGKRVNWRELPKEEWWVKGYLWVGNDFSCIIPHNVGITYNDKSKHVVAFAYEVAPKTICEYTGSTGKNGRKIFENDIVRAIYKPKGEDLTVDDFIIKWDKYYCRYVGYYVEKENSYDPLLFGSRTSFEVIGNIFDNPELLGSHLKE